MSFTYNTERVGHVIEEGRDELRSAIATLVDGLFDNGAIHVHRAWSKGVEREAMIERATQVALLSVLSADWCLLDEEARWLYVTRTEQKLSAVAAQ